MKGENEKRNEPVNPKVKELQARDILLPRRRNLHVASRITLGIIINLILALLVVSELGKTGSATKELLAVALPAVAITTLVPVICLGPDVPRLLAIGLSVLPSYVFVVGCGQVLSEL